MSADNNYGRGRESHTNQRELLEFKLKHIDKLLAEESTSALLKERLLTLAELMRY